MNMILAATLGLFLIAATTTGQSEDVSRAELVHARQVLDARAKEWAAVESALHARLTADARWVSAHTRWKEAHAALTAQGAADSAQATEEVISALHELHKLTEEISNQDPNIAATRLRLLKAKRRVMLLERDIGAATRPTSTAATTRPAGTAKG